MTSASWICKPAQVTYSIYFLSLSTLSINKTNDLWCIIHSFQNQIQHPEWRQPTLQRGNMSECKKVPSPKRTSAPTSDDQNERSRLEWRNVWLTVRQTIYPGDENNTSTIMLRSDKYKLILITASLFHLFPYFKQTWEVQLYTSTILLKNAYVQNPTGAAREKADTVESDRINK